MPLGPGTRLGPYEIQSALGAGGMGEVYKAKDTRLDRIVAIKVLPSHVSDDLVLRERFEREARTVAALNHPHICTLHDVGHQDGTDFLVLEYLDGQTLADRLTKGALPLAQALAIAIQVADAIDKAHRAGTVHRDLKPGNVMLTKSGAKLLDFGLAKVTPAVVAESGLSMAPTGISPVTMQGTILGTLQYMAPEQIEGEEADARTDIFAFGAVLYEMLTGRKAFEGKTQASLIGAIMNVEVAPPSTLAPITPPLLDRIIQTCLAKDRDRRWQSARDLADALSWVADGSVATATFATASSPAKRGSRFWMAIATATFGWALAAGLVAFILRPATQAGVPTLLDVVTPPSNDPLSFALSADGRQLAYVANGEGGQRLWVRPFDQATAKPLSGTEGAQFPFWSPDGRAIGFFADGHLKRVNLEGGVQVLATTPVPRGGSWNRDGVIVFSPNASGELQRIPASGGSATSVTRVAAGQMSHRWPVFLPDGRHFLFLVTGALETRGVYVAGLDGEEASRLLPSDTAATYAEPGYLLVAAQGALTARPFSAGRMTIGGDPVSIGEIRVGGGAIGQAPFSASATGTIAYRTGGAAQRQLIWVDRTGKTVGELDSPNDLGQANGELSHDGRRLAEARILEGNVDLWIMDLQREATTRLTFDPALDVLPVWSSDDTHIAFMTARKGRADLFDKPSDGSADERPLLVSAMDKAPLAYSPDGRFLLYAVQDPKTLCDLWALPLSGDRTPIPVVQGQFDDVQGVFSPDGRWLAYASNETGRYEVYVRPFPGPGGRWQVSTRGGIYPRWSHDGKELFFITLDNTMMAVSIQATNTIVAGTPTALFPTQLATGGNVGIGGYNSHAEYDVAPDGRFLLNLVANGSAMSPIIIDQNWDTLLKH